MSATITVGSLSLASDGKTLTGTLSGGSGSGYGPSTGVTGFTVLGGSGAFSYPLDTITISGSTVTIPLLFPIGTGDTPTVTLATSSGSNITDSGSNTPTGQSNVAVTNNSTAKVTAFASSNSALKQSGG